MSHSTSSFLWDYFSVVDSSFAKCNLCGSNYSRKGRGTTSLKNHLRSIHKEEFTELLQKESDEEKEGKKKAEIAKTPFQQFKHKTKQMTIKSSFETKKVWEHNNPKSLSLDRRIGEMLVLDDLPFSHVEDVGFRRLMNEAVPNYKLKCRKFLTKIKDRLMCSTKGSKVSFTTDVWSDTSAGVSLLSLTCYVLIEDFQRENYVLCAKVLDERHTGEYLSSSFDKMLSQWGILKCEVHCVMRDSGTNIKKALRLSDLTHLDCNIHKLQLVVESVVLAQKSVNKAIVECRSIATHFNHTTAAQDELKKIQERLNAPSLAVKQDVRTRWNSTLIMLKRMAELKEPLLMYSQNGKIKQITNQEWKTIESVIKVLQPFEKITRLMSGDKSTIAEVIPLIQVLKNSLQICDEDHDEDPDEDHDDDHDNFHDDLGEDQDYSYQVPGIKGTKKKISEELNQRFAFLDTDDIYNLSTILDPRYKTRFSSSCSKGIFTELLKTKLDETEKESTAAEADDTTTPPPKKRKVATDKSSEWTTVSNAMKGLLSSSSDDDESTSERRASVKSTKEVDQYLSLRRISHDNDPLSWWRENATSFPLLSKLARRYLACPPSSVPSERLFSIAGNIYDEKRNRLAGARAEKILFLKSNIPLLDK